jgi:plasmid stabilization system protein ParE
MQVRWTRRALRALDAIAEYIAHDRPLAASRMVARIREAGDHLVENPDSGRMGRVAGTRELVVSGTPFIIPTGPVKGISRS